MQSPKNGFMEVDMYGIVKTIKFACFPGYSLKGSENTTCTKDGRWTDPSPTCIGTQNYRLSIVI